MVKTRSGKRTEIAQSPGAKKTKKAKRVKHSWTHLYIVRTHPLTVSLTPKKKNDYPNKSYPYVILPGTPLYVTAQRHCNAKWYNNGKVSKRWIYNVFLTKDASGDWIKNYKCGEDKWIESSKIIETTLQK